MGRSPDPRMRCPTSSLVSPSGLGALMLLWIWIKLPKGLEIIHASPQADTAALREPPSWDSHISSPRLGGLVAFPRTRNSLRNTMPAGLTAATKAARNKPGPRTGDVQKEEVTGQLLSQLVPLETNVRNIFTPCCRFQTLQSLF